MAVTHISDNVSACLAHIHISVRVLCEPAEMELNDFPLGHRPPL